MKVYKFGGASVKDAEAVRNAVSIMQAHMTQGAVVISAMGKSTNALEEIWKRYCAKQPCQTEANALVSFHEDIVLNLGDESVVRKAFEEVRNAFLDKLEQAPAGTDAVEYDAIVSFGEFFSTQIIAAYAKSQGLKTDWFDVRNVVITDHNHRSANVQWEACEKRCATLESILQEDVLDFVITQGFVGRSELGNTTTLGREGSDYSGAILAYLLGAKELVIWKDVPGMLNADPRWFKETRKLEQISYREAIELSYYGASVIHPKTIKPLQNKNIPLRVRSFKEPHLNGSLIHTSTDHDSLIPSYIFKPEQSLVSISPRDFSFVDEGKMEKLFAIFAQQRLHVQLIQNSALNLSVCLDTDEETILQLIKSMGDQYLVKYNLGLELWTVRHANQRIEDQLKAGKEVIIKQQSRHTLRMLLR